MRLLVTIWFACCLGAALLNAEYDEATTVTRYNLFKKCVQLLHSDVLSLHEAAQECVTLSLTPCRINSPTQSTRHRGALKGVENGSCLLPGFCCSEDHCSKNIDCKPINSPDFDFHGSSKGEDFEKKYDGLRIRLNPSELQKRFEDESGNKNDGLIIRLKQLHEKNLFNLNPNIKDESLNTHSNGLKVYLDSPTNDLKNVKNYNGLIVRLNSEQRKFKNPSTDSKKYNGLIFRLNSEQRKSKNPSTDSKKYDGLRVRLKSEKKGYNDVNDESEKYDGLRIRLQSDGNADHKKYDNLRIRLQSAVNADHKKYDGLRIRLQSAGNEDYKKYDGLRLDSESDEMAFQNGFNSMNEASDDSDSLQEI